MKIVSMTKSCGRKITDGNYGSIESSTIITVEEEIDFSGLSAKEASEKLQELSTKVSKQARVLTNQDLNEYLALKADGKVR